MCGIAGFVSLDGAHDRDQLAAMGRAMAAALSHRGPDGEGVWVSADGRVMLAARRLAVRDLTSAGDQPMASPDGRVVLVYNGELYRVRDARRTGWPRASTGDTEEFLQVVHAGGDLAGLDAMFAAAWYDRADGSLRLARDHFGVKPLVYVRLPDALVFASEPCALFATGLVKPALDPLTFVHKAFVRMDAVDELTWFRDVRALPPATLMTVVGGRVRTERYWTPVMADEPVDVDELRDAFAHAVTIRLPADVPQAAFVSGGLDSSAVFGALCAAGADVRPYIVRYEGSGTGQNDDVPYALEVARAANRTPVMCDVTAGELAELVDPVVERLGRPFLHGAELAMYRSYQQVAEHGATVVYSGHGADELWGYQDGRYFPVVSPDFSSDMHSEYYLRHRLYRDERPAWHRLLDEITASFGLAPEDVTDLVWERTMSAYREAATLDPHKRGRHHLMRRFLVYVNEMVDATSSAFALEDRPAFQDVTIAELAFRMPEYIKNREGVSDFKPFLKQAIRDFVPDSVVRRPKKGFPSPEHDRYRARLLDLVRAGPAPFGLDPAAADVDALGVGELMFLYSARRWAEHHGIVL